MPDFLERQKERLSSAWLTQDWAQAGSRSSTQVSRLQGLKHPASSAAFPVPWQGAGSEAQQLGSSLLSHLDCKSLVCRATTPSPGVTLS